MQCFYFIFAMIQTMGGAVPDDKIVSSLDPRVVPKQIAESPFWKLSRNWSCEPESIHAG